MKMVVLPREYLLSQAWDIRTKAYNRLNHWARVDKGRHSKRAGNLLDILLQASWRCQVHNSFHMSSIQPHTKCHCSYHNSQIPLTEFLLNPLPLLHIPLPLSGSLYKLQSWSCLLHFKAYPAKCLIPFRSYDLLTKWFTCHHPIMTTASFKADLMSLFSSSWQRS